MIKYSIEVNYEVWIDIYEDYWKIEGSIMVEEGIFVYIESKMFFEKDN